TWRFPPEIRGLGWPAIAVGGAKVAALCWRVIGTSTRSCRLSRSLPGEHDRDRARVVGHLPGRRQFAGVRVDPERDHGVVLFVCRVKEMPGGIETDEARRTALGRLPTDDAQQSLRISSEDGDAVVAAVGTVDKTAIRGDRDLCHCAVVGEV